MASLFDDFTRTSSAAAARSHSDFDYFNTTARSGFATARETLEDWFSRIPDSAKVDLRNRFRSADRYMHRAAYFELMLHELHLRLGCTIELHPAVPGVTTSPDFYAADASNSDWYLEGTIASDASSEDRAAAARECAALDEINKFQSAEVFFEVEIAAIGPGSMSGVAVFISSSRTWMPPTLVRSNPTGNCCLSGTIRTPVGTLRFDLSDECHRWMCRGVSWVSPAP
jgi:hypothetical protein